MTRRSHAHSFFAQVAFAAAVVAVLAGSASAQLGKKEKKKPAQPTQPEQPQNSGPGQGVPPPEVPAIDKILTLENPKDWTTNVTLHVEAGYVRAMVDKTIVAEPRSFQFQSAAVVFPVLESSASHKLADAADSFRGELFFNEQLADVTPTFAAGYQSGARFGRWELRKVEGKELDLKLKYNTICFETRYDDALAEKIAWPKKGYFGVAASALKPQMFVEYNGYDDAAANAAAADTTVADFLKNEVLGGRDPKSIPPARLAKAITGVVMEKIQPSGDGLLFNRNGSFRGFDLYSAAETIRARRGSEHEITCVLAAVLKAAEIPARTVIGWDVSDSKGQNSFSAKAGRGKYRSWVEFCLQDDVMRKTIWIPVDVVRIRRASSRAKPIDQPWKYFGSSDELAYIVPIAFQFHPPTTVVAQTPAMWGWLTTPESQPHVASLLFTAFRTERRGDTKKDKSLDR